MRMCEEALEVSCEDRKTDDVAARTEAVAVEVRAVWAQRFNLVQPYTISYTVVPVHRVRFGAPYACWPSAAASTRRGTRRPGDSRKIGICEVTGQVVSS